MKVEGETQARVSIFTLSIVGLRYATLSDYAATISSFY